MSRHDDFQVHRSRFEALMNEVLRLDPELRAAYEAEGSGGIGFAFPAEAWPQVTEALRALPDDAGREALARAIAPFLRPGPDAHAG